MTDSAVGTATLETTLPTPPDAPGAGARATLWASCLGMFVVTLDAVVVNVALPTIRAEFAAGMAGLQWIVDAYTLAVAALLLAAGALADRIGARTAYALGIVGFTAASLACALAPTLPVLIAARTVQGASASLLMPTSMSLIGQAFPDPARKARAVGLWAVGGALASSAGPLVGGALTTIDWRLIFWINVPVGVLTLVLVSRAQPSPRASHPFDLIGFGLSVVAMGAVTFAAIESGERGLLDPTVLGTGALAVLAGLAFVAAQRRLRHPMLPRGLFARPEVTMASVVGFAFMVSFYGTPFVMSLLLQQQRGLSSLQTGLVFLPMMLIGLVLTPFSARLVEVFGRRTVMLVGIGSMASGAAGLGLLPDVSPVAISMLLVLVGVGGPTLMPPATASMLNAVDAERAGTASGVLNTSRQIGGALAVAVFGALLSTGFRSGVGASMAVTVVLLALAGVVIVRSVPETQGR